MYQVEILAKKILLKLIIQMSITVGWTGKESINEVVNMSVKYPDGSSKRKKDDKYRKETQRPMGHGGKP